MSTGFVPSPRRTKSLPRAIPSAAIVLGSSGGLPATPRIPSVPNNCFAIYLSGISTLQLLHLNLYSNLRRIQNPYLRFGGVYGQRLSTDPVDLRKIELIGDQLARF